MATPSYNVTDNTLKSQQEHKLDRDRYHIQPDSKHLVDHMKVLNHGNSFAIMNAWGDIYPDKAATDGIYHRGTRFINEWVLRLDGKNTLLLGSTIKQHNNIHSVDLTNPVLRDGKIPENTIHIFRHQLMLDDGFYEKINCVNYNESEVACTLSLYYDGDFRDIFEIRGTQRTLPPGTVHKHCDKEGGTIHIEYMGRDRVRRIAAINYEGAIQTDCKAQKMVMEIQLKPHEQIHFQLAVHFGINRTPDQPLCFESAKAKILEERAHHDLKAAHLRSTNTDLNSWINRAYTDLFSLHADIGDEHYVFAGVPWYNTPFGRDGIITALEMLWIQPGLAKEVLQFLSDWQADDFSMIRDSEPGKILHEAREGEMANTGEIPFKRYYGTVDATPLYIILAGKYFKRTGDINFIKGIWNSIMEGLQWIDQYGDIDGDLFIEYQFKNPDALTNQGWKDSVDAIMREDGTLAHSPIALCEVQGYVYQAKLLASEMASRLEDQELSGRLFAEAGAIKKKFNEVFWDAALNCYVLALDGDKVPCRVKASNSGHALFTGIAETRYATLCTNTLMSDQLFSNWGIRTLATDCIKFNPMSYHNGSVWPHDNALIVMGFARFGFKDAALKVFDGLFEATTFIELHRLPELFCGLKKRSGEGPTAYPVACSPQAWAVGSVFLLLEALLGMEMNAPDKQLFFHDPVLPAKVDALFIQDFMAGDQKMNIRVYAANPVDPQSGSREITIKIENLPEDWGYQIRKDSRW